MLATRVDRRGEGSASVHGAMAFKSMNPAYCCEGFMTGVHAGNAASEWLCEKLAIVSRDYCVIGSPDPALFSRAGMTE